MNRELSELKALKFKVEQTVALYIGTFGGDGRECVTVTPSLTQ